MEKETKVAVERERERETDGSEREGGGRKKSSLFARSLDLLDFASRSVV